MLGDHTIAVRRVTPEDISGVAGALGRAFQDDPLMSWVVPKDDVRARKLGRLFELMLRKGPTLGTRDVFTTDGHMGAAIWAAPGTWKTPMTAMLPMVPGLVRLLGFGTLRRFMAAMNAIEKCHPHEPHWYLEGLGTDPPHQRKGVGAALMRDVLERCDTEGIPAYLETQKERNVPYYRTHGFEVRSEIDLPLKGPHLWLMWREPQA